MKSRDCKYCGLPFHSETGVSCQECNERWRGQEEDRDRLIESVERLCNMFQKMTLMAKVRLRNEQN